MPWLPERLPDAAVPVWSCDLGSDGVGGIAVAGGVVIAGTRDAADTADMWVALDAATGVELWRLLYPAPGSLDYGNSPRATPLVAGGVAYLLGAQGHLHAVDPATGLILWQKDLAQEFGVGRLEWGLTGSPLLAGGKLIVQPGGSQGCLVALDPLTGEVLWKSEPGLPGHASPVAATIAGKPQVVAYDAESLGGWDLGTGKRLWQVKPRLSGDFNVPTPIVLDGERLLVCTENNGARMVGFDAGGAPRGEPLARYDALNPDSHTPVVSAGRVYGIAGGLHCLDAEDGLKELWVFDDPAVFEYASLMACGRRLLVLSAEAELVLLEDEGQACRVLSRLMLDPEAGGVLSHPALVGSRLYARTGNRLACYELAPALQTPSKPARAPKR